MRYIHLSGRELAARFHRATTAIHADREQLLTSLLEEQCTRPTPAKPPLEG
ncbi:hypothetical protein [Streptomyces sp. SP18BB07]|uniref:hypothetical protein n=1 Tax=Streptomyces sp. SP18BB07 TaxID=3002522 RepID=UPI002E75DE5A|nr:hypothetical protein [Streptomyces sp. SP18BB07]MEE1764541.1 hypothetical protein [Streptomyces sp. SP18BB07]